MFTSKKSQDSRKFMDLPTIPMISKRVLVVDDDSRSRKNISKQLEIEGYTVYQAQDSSTALRYVQQLDPDLIISDVSVPGSNGSEFYRVVRQTWTTIPFILLISKGDTRAIQRGREMGVEDYLVKPVEGDTLVRIVHARLLRSAELQVALIDEAYLNTVEVLANTVEGRDPYTHGHIGRVAMYAEWLAEALGWPKEQLRVLAFGARLHDIGKIIIPDHILKKPGDLTADEWELMKQHPTAGARILSDIKHLNNAVNYVLYHHERWDGSGYPNGLKGRDIPMEGRLLAIADVYDALTTDRPYHPARPRSEVISYLNSRAGVQFDPDLVPIFEKVLERHAKM